MGAQWNQRGKPQYAGSYLCPDCCVDRRSARLSLLPFCQTASAFRLICLFHTFFRRGVYRATVFAPLRRPKFFRFPFACLRAAPSACFAHLLFAIVTKRVHLHKRQRVLFPKRHEFAPKQHNTARYGNGKIKVQHHAVEGLACKTLSGVRLRGRRTFRTSN